MAILQEDIVTVHHVANRYDCLATSNFLLDSGNSSELSLRCILVDYITSVIRKV